MTLTFTLPAELTAHEPPEAHGQGRDGVRLLLSEAGRVSHHRFVELPSILRAGDVLVVNTSATLPAAVDVSGAALAVHFSTELPDDTWLVELRRRDGKASEPYRGGVAGRRYPLAGGGAVTLRQPYAEGRLWKSEVDTGSRSVPDYLHAFGAPIRYSYVPRRWPLSYYQTVFSITPGSAEMPSAARPFTEALVTRLVAGGVQFAPILLHTGVASPEAHERPYPERFAVSAQSADLVNAARAQGRRVIAVGTTAVRAIESAADGNGIVSAKEGWTDVIITPERGVRVVDGLLTGLHEPRASHVDMLAAVVDGDLLCQTYAEAIAQGYLWHEFGDVNLLLR